MLDSTINYLLYLEPVFSIFQLYSTGWVSQNFTLLYHLLLKTNTYWWSQSLHVLASVPITVSPAPAFYQGIISLLKPLKCKNCSSQYIHRILALRAMYSQSCNYRCVQLEFIASSNKNEVENNMESFYLNEVYGITQWIVYSFLAVKYSGIFIILNIIEGFSYIYRVAYQDSPYKTWLLRREMYREIQ